VGRAGVVGRHRARRRLARAWSRLTTTVLVLGCLALIVTDADGDIRGGSARGGSLTPLPSGPAVPVPSNALSPSPTGSGSPAPDAAGVGDGTFAYASGDGFAAGASGRLLRYRVAVEGGVGVDPAEFAEAVEAVLADPRGWTLGGLRLQRVDPTHAADFTVMLASPVTSERLCRTEGMETGQFTNCRLHGRVVINSARWLTGVLDYGAPLSVYRAYAVNHEVGHELGAGHELCPGPGLPAPVMQQQTLGLHGCVANPWPYLDGARYRGPTASE
jgi:hypothetical protein